MSVEVYAIEMDFFLPHSVCFVSKTIKLYTQSLGLAMYALFNEEGIHLTVKYIDGGTHINFSTRDQKSHY